MKHLVLYIAFLLPRLVPAQDAIDTTIQNQMARQKIVSLSVGIVKNGKVMTTRSYGIANVEHGVRASENTAYKLGSVSKQIVATAIMQMVESKRLSLQDSVQKFFKDAPRHWRQITIRHLLNHTSGLQRESPAFEPMLEKPDSLLIRAAYKDTLAFPTGTQWQYCNLSYFILADIIRQLSGQPFAVYMREMMFKKNGLLNTQTTSVSSIIPNRAGGYVNNNGTLVNAEDYIALRPSGAFVSTVNDMVKWEMALQQNSIMTENTLQQMWSDKVKTPAKSTNGEPIYYGYGWRITRYRGKDIVFHTGVLPGFRAVFYRIPSEKIAIIILTNSETQDIVSIAEGLVDRISE
jgi:CubicO group peptidase (beta-lactamase class C family)